MTGETEVGRLTTHVLDLAAGKPAAGLALTLLAIRDGKSVEVAEAMTNADGRIDKPLLEGASLQPGTYELRFQAGTYFDRQGLELPEPKFLDEVVLRFGIASADQHYHVPLLLSPFGYSTYRGS
ncbi:MAG: hydroxyisourate hydrolase [Hyphomicrobiaceae bacterium]